MALALPLILALTSTTHDANAFCGFYVGGADAKLFAPRLVEYWEQDPCYKPPEYQQRLDMEGVAPSASMADVRMNEADVESAEIVDSPSGAYVIDPDEPEAAALNWLENEKQMSIDPTNAPQQVTACWSCTRPPKIALCAAGQIT